MKPSALLFVGALALALAATGAMAIGEPYPTGDCRTGTPACPNGCCSAACPTGAAGIAIPNGTPGLTATIKGLTYDPKTALVRGTVVMTNAGKTAVNNLIASVQFAPFAAKDGSAQTLENLWCGGQKGKALAPGASRACPFALVGGADPSKYDWNKATSRDPLPGVDANALKSALSFSTSEVPQVVELKRGLKPSAISAHATLRNTELYPQPGDKSGGFICGYAFVPAVAAQ